MKSKGRQFLHIYGVMSGAVKHNPKTFKWKIGTSMLASLFFTALLIQVNWLHFRYFPVNVIFYSAMTSALVALSIMGICLLCFKPFRILSAFEKCQLMTIFLLLGYGYAISVPTVVDRSLSIYLLEKIDQRGGGIRLEAIPEIFIQEYLPEHRLMDVRLTEQIESGTIVVNGYCVRLTKKGKRVVFFSHLYRKYMLPRKRLLMGEYTDDLVDPFRNSRLEVDYECR